MPKKKTKKKRSTVKDAAISADLASAIVERLEINADFEAGSDSLGLTEEKLVVIRDSFPKLEPDEDGMIEIPIKSGRDIVSGGAWC